MKVRGIRPSDLDRRKKYDVGSRLPPDEARKRLRVAVLKALADRAEPITAVDVWRLMDRPDQSLLVEVLDELVAGQLVERGARRLTPDGRITHHFSLTARE